MSRVFRSGWSGGRCLFLLHLMCLIYLGKFLLHVVVQALVTGFVLFFVDFDTDNPLTVAAWVVLSIFCYSSGNRRWYKSTTVR